ncbi:MAG: lipocalin family protein [Ignavibacteriales bacterium]
MMMKKLSLFFLTMISFSCSTQNYAPLPVVEYVDVNKYTGKWYEVARLPFKQQEGCTCTTAEYEIIDSTTLAVKNKCKKDGEIDVANGKAFVVEGTNNAKLRVQFFWPFRGDYWIIFLDQNNYNWAVVGTPSRKYLWILSRTPQMKNEIMNNLIKKIHDVGFDTDKLIFTEQNCE